MQVKSGIGLSTRNRWTSLILVHRDELNPSTLRDAQIEFIHFGKKTADFTENNARHKV
jgi:hypothetical protein